MSQPQIVTTIPPFLAHTSALHNAMDFVLTLTMKKSNFTSCIILVPPGCSALKTSERKSKGKPEFKFTVAPHSSHHHDLQSAVSPHRPHIRSGLCSTVAGYYSQIFWLWLSDFTVAHQSKLPALFIRYRNFPCRLLTHLVATSSLYWTVTAVHA